MTHDKATEGRTEAAAVDQAIAWFRRDEPMLPLTTSHGRVLADAVEELQANSKFVQELEFENVRLARQVADLEDQIAAAHKSLAAIGGGPCICAVCAAARSRDPQEGA